MKSNHSDIIDIAISQNRQLLTTPDIVGAPMHGQMLKNRQWVNCINVHIKSDHAGNIPGAVNARLANGQTAIPVNVVSGLGVAQAQSGQGNSADALSTPDFKGTICCQVKDSSNNKFLLTCSHVMTGGISTNYFGPLSTPVAAQVAGMGNFRFTWAKCDTNYDMALISPGDDNFTYTIMPGVPRALTLNDNLKTVTLVKSGGATITGKIVNYCSADPIPIKYKDRLSGMVNLIVLANIATIDDEVTYSTLTVPGDSGACVYDDANNPVGMIVGGDTKFSYAISLVLTLTELNTTLI